jgi:Transcriptional regulatory protein, C terminal
VIDRTVPGAPARLDAEILTWPDQESRRQQLAVAGVPRLLLLERGHPPPSDLDRLEDWIWVPADERDVFARLRHLAVRSTRSRLVLGDLTVAGGLLRVGGHRLRLPPVEAAILDRLASPPESLHTRGELAEAAWGDDTHTRRSLDSRILVLRRRLAPLGLEIRAVRGRGFVLTARAQEAS